MRILRSAALLLLGSTLGVFAERDLQFSADDVATGVAMFQKVAGSTDAADLAQAANTVNQATGGAMTDPNMINSLNPLTNAMTSAGATPGIPMTSGSTLPAGAGNTLTGSTITNVVNGAVSTAGGVQTGTAPVVQAGSNPLGRVVTGVQNGAQIGADMQTCSASVAGKATQIGQSYESASSSFADPSSLGSAGNAAQLLFGAYFSTADAETMWKLYQIYTNQQKTGDTATAVQEAAYTQVTPQCKKAFTEIDKAYGNAQTGAANFLTSTDRANNTCYAFGQTSAEGYQIRFNLCVAPSKTVPQGKGLAEALAANFTNAGVPLCNLTFYVKDLANAYSFSPAWMPIADKQYPEGMPTDTLVRIAAQIPYDITTYDAADTLFDIKTGWYACPFGKNGPPPAAVPAATAKPAEVKVSETILAGRDACFATAACVKIAGSYLGDDCTAYNKLFTSTCHKCSADVVRAAKQACLTGCSEKQCDWKPQAAASQSSGAGSLRMSALALVAGVAAAFAYAL